MHAWVLADLAESEVGDLDVLDAVAAKNVLRLKVAVHDSHLVQVRHALDQGLDHRESLKSRKVKRQSM